MGIQINGTTNNINAGIGSLTIDDIREIDIIGVATASNFKTGTSNVHSTGYDCTNINASGIITAASFYGDISNATGGSSAGLGTALSSTQTSPLNKLYYTDRVLKIGSTVTVDHPASATGAYTQYADIQVEDNADLIVADGDDLIPDILGLGGNGSTGAGGAGRLLVDNIVNRNATGAPTFPNGAVVTGIVTATTFYAPGGILQVKQTIKKDQFTTSSTVGGGGYVDLTGLSVTITPKFNTSKILIECSIYNSNANAVNFFRVLRGNTFIEQPSGTSSSGANWNAHGFAYFNCNSWQDTTVIKILDSPATVSATTYKVQCAVTSAVCTINKFYGSSNYYGISSITVSEVAA